MSTASLAFDSWSVTCREIWRKLVPRCDQPDCLEARRRLRGITPPRRAVMLRGQRYCLDGCLEKGLLAALAQVHSAPRPASSRHRVPLGLLLLSRRQVSEEQLRTALAAQKKAGRGRIGEWLEALGFVSEAEVTAAVARQWSCPVLRGTPVSPESRRLPQLPLTLLEAFATIPVDYVAATSTLHLASSDGIDHSFLYAIERMAVCRTEPCMAEPSLVRRQLEVLAQHNPAQHNPAQELVFDRLASRSEFSRIIGSYCGRLHASEILLATCGAYLWARLVRHSRSPVDLLLRCAS